MFVLTEMISSETNYKTYRVLGVSENFQQLKRYQQGQLDKHIKSKRVHQAEDWKLDSYTSISTRIVRYVDGSSRLYRIQMVRYIPSYNAEANEGVDKFTLKQLWRIFHREPVQEDSVLLQACYSILRNWRIKSGESIED